MRHRLIAAVCVLAVALGLAGCTETKFVPPTPDVRQHLGKMAAFTMPAQSSINVEKPVSGAGGGALMGFGQGALGGLAAGMSGCYGGPYSCALGLALGVAAAIVAAPIGAIVGATKAHSEQEVRAADASLRAALADIKPGEELSKRIVAATKSTTTYDMIAMPSTDGNENLTDLSAKGFGSVAEVTIIEFQLLSAGKIDPDVSLTIAAQVLLRQAPGGSDLYQRKWAYIGVQHNYFAAAANDAAMLRSEIQSGLDMLGDRIVADLFTSNSPELKETSPRRGTVITIEGPTLKDQPAAQQPTQTSTSSAPPPQQASAPQPPSGGVIDVPFRIDLQGQEHEGVGKLENGHFTGQVQYGNKTVVLTGEIKEDHLSVEATGALNSNSFRLATGSTSCTAEGSARPAKGQVTIPMRASCAETTVPVVLHLDLPAA